MTNELWFPIKALGRRVEGSMKTMTLAEFTAAAVQYCMAMDASVTSWIRTPQRNTEKGGTKNSRHLTGMAIDVVYDAGLPPHDRAQAMAAKLGLYAYRGEGYGHDHLRPV